MGNRFVRTKSKAELEEHLAQALGQLRRSAMHYDDGHKDEAQRLATSIYLLLVDSGKSNQSLASQLDLKPNLKFLDTSIRTDSSPEAFLVGPPLCQVGPDGTYWPKFRGSTHEFPALSVDRWLSKIVFNPTRKLRLSRKNLIMRLRNQDGGGHVDPIVTDEAYHELQHHGDIYVGQHDQANFIVYFNEDWKPTNGQVKATLEAYFEEGQPTVAVSTNPPPSNAQPIKHAHWGSMRQIAWEVDEAFKALGV